MVYSSGRVAPIAPVEAHAATWREITQSYYALVRRQLERFRGIEVGTEGDGFIARFDGPARAVSCACAIRVSVQGLGLSI